MVVVGTLATVQHQTCGVCGTPILDSLPPSDQTPGANQTLVSHKQSASTLKPKKTGFATRHAPPEISFYLAHEVVEIIKHQCLAGFGTRRAPREISWPKGCRISSTPMLPLLQAPDTTPMSCAAAPATMSANAYAAKIASLWQSHPAGGSKPATWWGKAPRLH